MDGVMAGWSKSSDWVIIIVNYCIIIIITSLGNINNNGSTNTIYYLYYLHTTSNWVTTYSNCNNYKINTTRHTALSLVRDTAAVNTIIL